MFGSVAGRNILYLHSNMVLLIPNAGLLAIRMMITLHSNMVLLIHAMLNRLEEVKKTLHSNMVLLIRSDNPDTDFPDVSLHSNMVLLIPVMNMMNAGTSLFTFQYGSINTFRYPHKPSACHSLHSNMVLLILHQIRSCSPRRTPLHSNMVLLIPVFYKCLSDKHYSTIFCRPCHFLFFQSP